MEAKIEQKQRAGDAILATHKVGLSEQGLETTQQNFIYNAALPLTNNSQTHFGAQHCTNTQHPKPTTKQKT
jgi:thiamine monophosphate kinase